MSALVDLGGLLTDRLATPRPLAESLRRAREQIAIALPGAAPISSLVVGLYDPILEPERLPALWPCTELVVLDTAEALGASSSDRAELAQTLALMRKHLVPPFVIPDRVACLSTPMAALHQEGRRRAARNQSAPYPIIAALLHQRARMLEHQMLARAREIGRGVDLGMWDVLKSARIICRYGTAPAVRTGGAVVAAGLAREWLIELLGTALQAWVTATGVTASTQRKRRAHLELLLGLREPRLRTPPPPAPVRSRKPHTIRARWTLEPDDLRLSPPQRGPRLSSIQAVPGDAVAEGEGPIDYAPPATKSEPRAASPGSSPAHRLTDHVVMAGLGFIHDPSTAQLYEYAEVFPTVFARPVGGMSPEEIETALYWGLVCLHGLPPHILKGLRLGTQPTVDATMVLDVDAGVMRWCLPRIGFLGTLSPGCRVASREGSELASIPLLPLVSDLACRHAGTLHGAPGLVFPAGGLPRASARSGLRGAPNQPRIAQRLARSTPRWLRHYGLPAVVTDLLTGRFGFSTLATSAYLNVSQSQVGLAHVAAARAFHGEILKECLHRGVRLEWLEEPRWWAPREDPVRRFGSRIVPTVSSLQRAVAGLNARRRPVRVEARVSDLVRAWNLESVVSWLRLQWAAGLRPRRDPVVTAEHVDAAGGWLLVDDKASPFSREVRPVPVPTGELERLVRLRQTADRVRHRLRSGSPVELNQLREGEIFFVVVEQRAVPLAPPLVRAVLKEEGLADLIPWPLNAARHYWITRALELGVRLEMIEPFLGHVHEPLPWGPFGMGSLQRLAGPFRQLATAILGEVGFDER